MGNYSLSLNICTSFEERELEKTGKKRGFEKAEQFVTLFSSKGQKGNI